MATVTSLPPLVVLEDPAQIRAYVHPLRMLLLSRLVTPQTVTQVAREMSVRPANLTRHFRVLEDAGLIELVEKRDTGRNLEKYYLAIARSFDVRLASEPIADARVQVLSILRDELTTAIHMVPREASGPAVGLLEAARVDASRIPELQVRLTELAAEFGTIDDAAGRPYCLSLALYPAATTP